MISGAIDQGGRHCRTKRGDQSMSLQPPLPATHAAPSSARPAVGAAGAALAATMARAFVDDPFVSHLVPGRGARVRKLPGLFGVLFKLGGRDGACDVTDK